MNGRRLPGSDELSVISPQPPVDPQEAHRQRVAALTAVYRRCTDPASPFDKADARTIVEHLGLDDLLVQQQSA